MGTQNTTQYGTSIYCDGDPSSFYAKLGFVETDEWDGGERIMRLEL